MAFVERLIGPDENLVGVARLHWIYIVKAILWFAGITIAGGIFQTLIAMYLPIIINAGNFLFGLSILAGVFMFALYIGKMLFTEFGGRVLNYGYLDLDARFIEDLDLPAINDPYRFVKAMNAVRSQIKDDNMRVALDDGGANTIKTADAIDEHKQRRDLSNASFPRGKQKNDKLEDAKFDAMSNDAAENRK